MKNKCEYYQSHSKYTDAGEYLAAYQALATDLPSLCQQLQQLIIHYADDNRQRYDELNLRKTKDILSKIFYYDDRPLNEVRKLSHRIIGVCRDTALLACSVLRSRGVAARLRVGFANYFIPNFYLDGVCVEYFSSEKNRWCRVDTRTTNQMKAKLNLNIDLQDLPADKFILAGEAWQLVQAGALKAEQCGSRQYTGLWYLRNRLIHDLAMLNKDEMLIWDVWGLMDKERNNQPYYDHHDTKLLNNLAELTTNTFIDLKSIQDIYKNNISLCVPKKIKSYPPFSNMRHVKL